MYLICVTIISSKTSKKKWHCSICQKWYRNWRFPRTLWARMVYISLLNPTPFFWKLIITFQQSVIPLFYTKLIDKTNNHRASYISKKVWGLKYLWEETLESVEGRNMGSDKILVRRDLSTFWLMGRGTPSSSPPLGETLTHACPAPLK